jgi:hypothetical protein
MKKIFWLLLIVLSGPAAVQAQVVVNNQDINQNKEINYIELIIDSRLFGQGEVFAVIDYGQVIRLGTLRQHRIKNIQGKDRVFGSEIDIFNFLYKNGWLHETTYAVGKEGYIHHIFRRKAAVPVAGE